MKKIKCIFIAILFVCVSTIYANADKEDSGKIINFDSIKEVIKSDVLEEAVILKKEEIKKEYQKKATVNRTRFNVPKSKEFWSFYSEYWIVKNAQIIKWDFKKPDYGLELSFSSFLEDLGYFEKKFKIILANSPNITHFSLPTDNDDENIFILSLPFIRILDLSKLEISLLLFEGFIRSQHGYFKQYASTRKLEKILGSNIYNKKINESVFKELSNRYDTFILDKGYNFQQQYNVTKKVGDILKSNLKLWNSYIHLIKKINELIKTNLLYSNYTKIYPSPELQLNWLMPKKSKL